jgi:hypothetical protein
MQVAYLSGVFCSTDYSSVIITPSLGFAQHTSDTGLQKQWLQLILVGAGQVTEQIVTGSEVFARCFLVGSGHGNELQHTLDELRECDSYNFGGKLVINLCYSRQNTYGCPANRSKYQ